VRMHPLALAESGWVWVGAGSRPAGLRTGRAIPGLRRDAALPVRQNTRQGREGGALRKPSIYSKTYEGASPAGRDCDLRLGAKPGATLPMAGRANIS
jgi:hypothetical protein